MPGLAPCLPAGAGDRAGRRRCRAGRRWCRDRRLQDHRGDPRRRDRRRCGAFRCRRDRRPCRAGHHRRPAGCSRRPGGCYRRLGGCSRRPGGCRRVLGGLPPPPGGSAAGAGRIGAAIRGERGGLVPAVRASVPDRLAVRAHDCHAPPGRRMQPGGADQVPGHVRVHRPERGDLTGRIAKPEDCRQGNGHVDPRGQAARRPAARPAGDAGAVRGCRGHPGGGRFTRRRAARCSAARCSAARCSAARCRAARCRAARCRAARCRAARCRAARCRAARCRAARWQGRPLQGRPLGGRPLGAARWRFTWGRRRPGLAAGRRLRRRHAVAA